MTSTHSGKRIIAVVGPTASGKTELATRLAEFLKCEILSFDARQFYAEMSIGTARPTTEQMRGIPHHFVGHISIHHPWSAGAFAEQADKFLADHPEKHIVLVGGSGLYLSALINGIHAFPPIPEELRLSLRRSFEEKGLSWLQQEVEHLDPTQFALVDQKNPQRLLRILEICIHSGKPYSSQLKKAELPRYQMMAVAPHIERTALYERIDKRVELMMEKGLEEEAKELFSFRHLNALQTVGYSELFAHFKGEIDLKEAVQLIQRNTRRYAKRQLTWFRNQLPDTRWVDPHQTDAIMPKLQSFIQP